MRPTVTHVTTDRYPASPWLSLYVPYEDPFMGGRYVAWPDTTPRTDRPVRFMVVRAHPVFRAFSDAFRGNLPVTRIA